MQILQRRRPIKPAVHVQRLHRRAACAEVDRIAAHLDGTILITAMQDKFLRRPRDGIFGQSTRKPHTPVRAHLRPCRTQIIRQTHGHFAQAQFSQQAQGSIVDGLHFGIAQRFVLPATLPGRAWIWRRHRPLCHFILSPACAPSAHDAMSPSLH